LLCCSKNHPGLRLSAGATFILSVRAHPDVINRDTFPELDVHRVYDSAIDQVIPDVRLVGYDNNKESGVLQRPDGLRDAGEQPELLKTPWRIWLSIPDLAPGDHTVTIQKHCPPHD
jgi:hypothetical protein